MNKRNIKEKGKYLSSILISTLSLFSAVFIIVAITYSWYTFGLEIKVSDIQLGTTSSDTLLITVEEKNRVTSYDYEYQGNLVQVTGNGENFFEPISVNNYQISSSNDYGNTITSQFSSIDSSCLEKKSEEDLENKVLYLPFQFEAFRNISNIYISPECSITSPSDFKKNLCVSSYVKEEQNRFSMDYVIGALRIAIQLGTKTEDDSITYKNKYIWIPHPEFELNYVNDFYTLDPEGNKESVFTFHDSSDFYSVSASEFTQGLLKKSGVTYILGDMPSLYLKQLQGSEIGLARLVVWLEGTDRECQNPMIGYTDSDGNMVQGRFKFTFNITL